MYKSKTRLIVLTIIILTIYTLSLGYVYAKNSEVSDSWEVTITSDAKELREVHEIKFRVENNENVVSGKIAPGLKAISKIDVNLEKAKGKVDIKVSADESKINNEFVLRALVDGRSYNFGDTITVDSGRNIEICLELEWQDFDINQDIIDEELKIPISVLVSQNV